MPNDITWPEVKWISHREPHHSGHSGYDRLMDYLGAPVQPIDLHKRRSRLVPARLANILWRRSGLPYYGYSQFYAEVAAARELLLGSGRVFHVLYGEQWYRYLGLLSGVRKNATVATFHFPPVKLQTIVPSRKHLRRLDAVIAVGSSQVPLLESEVGPGRVHVVHHGVDTDFFRPGERGHCDGRPMCVFVGTHMRDFRTLRTVIQLTGERCPDILFTIVTSGDMHGALGDLPSVDLRSAISEDDLLKLYQRADILVLPLEDCTANNTVLEGLACGLPMIVSDVGAIRDYVSDDAAVLLPAHDADAMRDAIIDLLADGRRREEMGHAARALALKFAWPAVAERMVQVYSSVLN
jgi:glycosyltransferase involved in cell wall biosynthesis